ncbi:DUF6470 family protein [Brevibacillus laterosporus]|uniref:DUF6470 family protein n=1 Tax=Brevibacillus laterosporus TaxID=1465 RepID=UPI003D198D0D
MQLASLSMRSTPLLLNLQSPHGKQEIEQPRASMEIKQEAAILEIRQPQGELQIDSNEARENIDMRGPLRRSSDNAEYGYNKVMEAIEQAGVEGDQLRAFERGGNAIAEIAFEKSIMFSGEGVVAAGSLIGDGIEIRYEAKPVEIKFTPRGAKIETTVNPPVHKYTPAKVEAYVKQWNRLDIEVVGLNVDVAR